MTISNVHAEVARMDQVGKDGKWNMIFNELCADGYIRPLSVSPQAVTSIKKLDTPIDGRKFGISKDLTGCTVIECDGREFVVFESMVLVVTSLGASMIASDAWATHSHRAAITFEAEKFNYRSEVRGTAESSDQ